MTFGLCFGGDTEYDRRLLKRLALFSGVKGRRTDRRREGSRLYVSSMPWVCVLEVIGITNRRLLNRLAFFSGVQARIAEQMCRRAYNAYRAYSLQNRYPTKQAQHNGGRVSRAKMIKCSADQAGQVMQIKCT